MKHLLTLILLLTPLWAQAWWNEEWTYRLPLVVDTSKTGGSLAEAQHQVPVLVRLHAGNFDDFFSLQENLSDLRFVAEDDKTPLNFQVEHFDLISQVLLVWVVMPEIAPDKTSKLFMYFGNAKAQAPAPANPLFGPATALAVHFNDSQTAVADASGNAVALSQNAVEHSATGLIGGAAKFTAAAQLTTQNANNLRWASATGGAINLWLKIPASAQGRVLTFKGASDSISLDVNGGLLNLRSATANLAAANPLAADQWQMVTVLFANGQLQLLVNGRAQAQAALAAAELSGNLSLGQDGSAKGFDGEVDELTFYSQALAPSYFEFLAKNQGMNDTFLKVEKSEQLGAGGDAGVYKTIINSMDHISWVVVSILAVMMVIGWIIMIAKYFYLRAANKDNQAFLRQYEKLGNRDPALLDYDLEANQDAYADMGPIIQALFGKHDHYQSSPIFHLFHRGMKEVKARTGATLSAEAVTVLGPQAINSIRAALDAQMTREIQTMQAKMTFLTMSVSGGPFIGLFGTVAGVMITFGAIAAAGDVNINAIAPGVSAALVATVGGLLVAIPAMFGYNFLAGIIKDTIADMRVFADEYIAKLAEYYGEP
ncbi:MAG: DUF2341 domain-containing protein [Marinagarivorans sp.]